MGKVMMVVDTQALPEPLGAYTTLELCLEAKSDPEDACVATIHTAVRTPKGRVYVPAVFHEVMQIGSGGSMNQISRVEYHLSIEDTVQLAQVLMAYAAQAQLLEEGR